VEEPIRETTTGAKFRVGSLQNTSAPKNLLLVGGLWCGLWFIPRGMLTAARQFARVRVKLPTKAFLCVAGSLKRIERDFKGRGATRTKANGGCGSDPLRDAKITLFHFSVSHRLGSFADSSGKQTPTH